ncbi:sulfotransferase domain-containing protein (plasmid) [Dinoroseobacter shibae]|nr:sulfotransferase domain-containing protein [Dinoroseobacter shibae]URF49095.1 sulfotransferase domain-containing protein [Dinoroseobacter shibae]URF53404.1 sulfotransferase domain-containing protein [Dinoroseobacter shibae]
MKLGRHHLNQRTLRKMRRDLRHRIVGLPWMNVSKEHCILASWPRSGNTWLRHILFFYFYQSDQVDMTKLDQYMPLIDSVDLKTHLAAPNPAPYRFIKSHELGVPYFLNGRIILIVRDGRDATYSWHHYMQSVHGLKSDFPTFLGACLRDRYRYKSWHTNLASWLDLEAGDAMLILRYEDTLTEPDKALRRILAFLKLPVDEERLQYALEKSSRDAVSKSFQTMKNTNNVVGFSGTAGGPTKERWRSTFTKAQNDTFVAQAGALLSQFGYPLE